jgi:D-amino-acid dehydrogenase
VDVIVVGAGVIGAACAYELAGVGARVSVLERGGGWGEGCSWGNAGLIVPSHARPIAAPESLRAGLGWMLRRDSPFGLRLRPSLAPWLLRYVRASTAARAAAGEALQRDLAVESLGMLRELADRGIDAGFEQRGVLVVHTAPDGEADAAAEAASETGRALGARALTAAEARELEPSLSEAVRAGVLFPGEARCDPVRLVRGLGAAAAERGAELRERTEVLAVRPEAGGVAVETTRGTLRAGHAVLAAGAWSGRLAAAARVPLPLQGGKGYAVEWEPGPLRMPLYLHDERCVANPMSDRLRMTGGLLLDGLDERFDARRVKAIRAAAANVLGVRAEPRLYWRGLRPCTPDGLPVIGAHPRAPRLLAATGHGMLGVTLAPLTGRLIAGLVAGRADHPALARLSPERFTTRARRSTAPPRRACPRGC